MTREAESHATTKRRAGPLGRGPGRLLGLLAEPIYRFEIARRNRAFDAGEGVVRLDRPVVSVGNLSVGGTGKTPMVAKIVGELVRAGKRPCIAMRGYGKDRGTSGESDEAMEYRRAAPGVPVVAQADRVAGLQALFDSAEGKDVDVVVLDDGFQHRRLARDVDIVLIDATAGTLEDRLLPAGWLREPLESLNRAHAVVVTHAEGATREEVDRIVDAVQRASPRAAVAVCRHSWSGLRRGSNDGIVPTSTLSGCRVLVVSAIGNARAFSGAVRGCGARVEREIVLPDHDPYDTVTVESVARAAEGLEAVVTTEKDWTKLGNARVEWPCPVYRPVLELAFDEGWGGLWGAISNRVGASGTSPTLHVSGSVGERASTRQV
jgi:tetraacyldisaccharide 4'-kinase